MCTSHDETRHCLCCKKRCYMARQNRQPILHGCVRMYITLSERYNKTIIGVAYYGDGECEARLGFAFSD